MQPPTVTVKPSADHQVLVPSEERALPSGRTVVVKADGRGEVIEVRSSGGEVELRIALTNDGPVLSLSGARLEINATDTVALNCRHLAVRATEGVSMEAGGDIALKSAGDTFIDGKLVKLNCLDRTGYPDDPAPSDTPRLPEP